MSLKRWKIESKTIDEERKKNSKTYNYDFLFFIWYTRKNGSKNDNIVWKNLVSTKLDKIIYMLNWGYMHTNQHK